MTNKQYDEKDGLLELLKKLWLPIAGFIGAVTLAYNFYKLSLGDQATVTYFTAGAGLLVLVIALAWVGFSNKTINLDPGKPFDLPKKEKIPRHSLWLRRIAWTSLLIIFIGMVFGGNSLVQQRQATAKAQQELENKLVVVIATFDGPEEVYGLRNEIIESLNSEFAQDQEVKIVTVDDVITLGMGRTFAQNLGERYFADLVIWGWYRPTENPNITVHIENLSPTQIETLQESETYEPQATLAQLESFEIQRQLGSETSTLVSFLIGTLKYKSGDYQTAIERFQQVLSQNDISTFISRSDLFFNLGYSNYKLEKFDSAIQDYDRAIELDPEYVFAYYNRGNAYYALSDYGRAIDDYDRVIELHPEYVFAYNNRGNAYKNLEQYERAIQDYDKAIKLDPEYVFSYYNRGNAYYALSDYGRAIDDYDRVIELHPESVLAYNNRGNAYRNLEQFERAIQDYDRVIELDPEYVFAYNNRGIAYKNLEQYERAIQDYDKAIELDPESVLAYNNRGNAYYALSDYGRAIDDYDRVIELDPQYAVAYGQRGIAYQALGKTTEAEADFKKYEELTGQKP